MSPEAKMLINTLPTRKRGFFALIKCPHAGWSLKFNSGLCILAFTLLSCERDPRNRFAEEEVHQNLLTRGEDP